MKKGGRNAFGAMPEHASLRIIRSHHRSGRYLHLPETGKEEIMLFLQIVATLTLAVALVVAYRALFSGQKPREIRQNQATVVVGNLIVIHSRDTYFAQTEYRLAGTPPDAKVPIITLKRYYDGETDLQLGMTPGRAPIENLGAHKLALLEQALPDIKGRLADKKT